MFFSGGLIRFIIGPGDKNFFDGERFFIFEPSEKTKIDEYIDEQLNKSGMGIIGKKKKALYATALEKCLKI